MAATLPPAEARRQLERDIISEVKQSIHRFYAIHPDWWDDVRSRANIDSRMECARKIIELLADYDICSKS